MSSMKSILIDIQTLPLNQIEELLSYLEEFLILGMNANIKVGQIRE